MLEQSCIAYLKDLFDFTEAWTISTFEDSELPEKMFKKYLALWWRAYLACLEVIGYGLSLGFAEFFQSQAVGLNPRIYSILSHPKRIMSKVDETNPGSRPFDFAGSEVTNLNDFVETMVKSKKPNADFYQKGEQIVLFKDGCDFAYRFKTKDWWGSDGHFDALIDTRFLNCKGDQNEPTWKDLVKHYKKLTKILRTPIDIHH